MKKTNDATPRKDPTKRALKRAEAVESGNVVVESVQESKPAYVQRSTTSPNRPCKTNVPRSVRASNKH
jgi:hypothetical protein